MRVRRKTWTYRLAGDLYARTISFPRAITELQARMLLRQRVGAPQEIWSRGAPIA